MGGNFPKECSGVISKDEPSVFEYAGCVDALIREGDMVNARQLAQEALSMYDGENMPTDEKQRKQLSLLSSFNIPEKYEVFESKWDPSLAYTDRQAAFKQFENTGIENHMTDLYNMGVKGLLQSQDFPHLGNYAASKVGQHHQKLEKMCTYVGFLKDTMPGPTAQQYLQN